MIEEFTIYRPEQSTGRLEGTYYQGDKKYWRPSLSYKHNIRDIRNQFTPAEDFRHTLATSGKYIRMIQRLELRWNRNYEEFTRAATKVQALHRGNVSRIEYDKRKAQLYLEMRRRQANANASACFNNKDFIGAIYEIDMILPGTVDLLAIKMKAQYRVAKYYECIATSEEIIGSFYL